jgi:hypothetical protein
MIAKEIKADGANSPAFFWIRESAGKWLNPCGLTASKIKIRSHCELHHTSRPSTGIIVTERGRTSDPLGPEQRNRPA